jgi:hypothetical protein
MIKQKDFSVQTKVAQQQLAFYIERVLNLIGYGESIAEECRACIMSKDLDLTKEDKKEMKKILNKIDTFDNALEKGMGEIRKEYPNPVENLLDYNPNEKD